jgi:general secretion pathway protein F/type IV pilus assembly protein PilC
MPEFAYIARDLEGRQVRGRLSAATEGEVLSQLDQRALFPVQVKADEPRAQVFRTRRVKAQLVATAYGQLADLLRSGVPLLRSLEVLRKQITHAGLIAVIDSLHAQVQEGGSLAEAMARHPKVFTPMAISMVRAGGEGGFLEESLDHVADFTEKQEDMKSRTIGAVVYPAFLAVFGTLIVAGLLVFIVPKFETMFDRLRTKGKLPVLTDWLLALSGLVQRWWWAILLVGAIGFVFTRLRLATEQGRLWRDGLLLRLPVAGKIFLNLAAARFCRVLGTMLRNGVPILRALEISSDAAGNRLLAAAIRSAAENISAGQSLARPLAACGHFPGAVVEMIAVAEESNSLDRVLVEIADSLDRRTWRQLDLAVRLLEPLMLLVLAVVVLLLAIALLMPVIEMGSTI